MLKKIIRKIKQSKSFRQKEAQFSRKLKKARKVFGILAISMFLVQMSIAFGLPHFAAARDYDSNAVIYGGAYSRSELLSIYRSGSDGRNSDIKNIFDTIGIYEPDINNLKNGTVTKSGNVYVGGALKASGVYSAGRSNMSGSVKDASLPIYWRRPSVSFRSSSLAAFVHLDGEGNFVYAILKSCGNPIAKVTSARFRPTLKIVKEVVNYKDTSGGSVWNWKKATNADTGDRVVFRLSVSNLGPVSALNVKVKDSLPSKLQAVSNTVPSGLLSNGHSLGHIRSGGKEKVTFRATVKDNAAGETLTNTASVDAANTPKDTSSAVVVVNKVVTLKPVLIITHEVCNITQQDYTLVKSNTADPCDTLGYRLTISNIGNDIAHNVVVRDSLPSYLSYVPGSTKIFNASNPNGASLPDGIINRGVNIGDIVPGQDGFSRVTFRAQVDCGIRETTQITNTIFAQATNHRSISDTALTLVSVPTEGPELALSKSAYNITQGVNASSVAAQEGDRIRYTLQVRNTGDVSMPDYIISDDISDILEYAEVVNLGGGNLVSGIISYPAVDIDSGETVSRTFEVEVKSNSEWPEGGDFVMTNIFGNRVDVSVRYPGAPGVGVTPSAPLAKAGATLNMIFGYFFLLSSIYLYGREKLLLQLALLKI